LKRDTALAAAFLGACALISWSWQRAVQDQRSENGDESADVAGYYMVNAGFVSPGPDGQPLYRLDAARMTHGVTSGLVKMEGVRIEYKQPSNSDWIVTAPEGLAQLDWQTLRLQGGVRVVMEPRDQPTIVLDTPALEVDAGTNRAYTEEHVSFSQGPHTVDAEGMTVDLTAGLVRLESRVNGLFKP